MALVLQYNLVSWYLNDGWTMTAVLGASVDALLHDTAEVRAAFDEWSQVRVQFCFIPQAYDERL